MVRVVHIVDDDEQVRDSLALLLQSLGFAAATFESGDIFLDHANVQSEDVVLLDLRMPGRSGLEVLSELRNAGSVAKVIIMTGHALEGLLTPSERDTISGFLEKPFDVAELVTLLREL